MAVTWQLDSTRAYFSCDSWECSIDLSQPQAGLNSWRYSGKSLGALSILQIRGVEFSATKAARVHVRGRDLIASYDEGPERPFSLEVYWRAMDLFHSHRDTVGMEGIVSVQTRRLSVNPEIQVGSRLTCRSLQLGGALPHTPNNIAATDLSSPLKLTSDEARVVCLVFREVSTGISYCEMLHPLDVHETNISPIPDQPSMCESSHRLFVRRLEKGVILRARLRCVLCSTQFVEQISTHQYERLSASEPPLAV